MKQLGNLAIVCAQRRDICLHMQDGKVAVIFDDGAMLRTGWDDDEKIQHIIYVLNFGRFSVQQEREPM